MDELEKIKIYAQMLLEVVNQAEKKRYEEKAASSAAEEQKMLIDFSGVCVCAKPRSDGRYCGYYTYKGAKRYVYGKTVDEVKLKIEHFLKYGIPPKKKSVKPAAKKKATPTVSEWLTKWAELYKAPNLKPKTMLGLRGCVRVVPVPSEALRLLGEPKQSNELVFPVSYSGVHSCLRRMSASLGFTVTAHLLRHTYATRLEEAGISPKMKQYLMGHASLEMTQNVYTDVQPEYIKENAGRILSAFDNCLTTKTTGNALGTH